MGAKTQLNMHEAKTHLSKLVERVERGEEITIARNGKPVAKLVPVEERFPVAPPGFMKGEIEFLPGYEEADKEIEELFERSMRGEEDEPA